MKKRLLATVLVFTLILPLLFSSCSILRILRERINRRDKESVVTLDTETKNEIFDRVDDIISPYLNENGKFEYEEDQLTEAALKVYEY